MTATKLKPISDVEKGFTSSTAGGFGTLQLNVDALSYADGVPDDWDEIGDYPFLHESTTHRVETEVTNKEHGYFSFGDSGKSSETIDDVICYVYVQSDGNDGVDVWIHDGNEEHKITPAGGVQGTSEPPNYGEEPLDYCYTHNQQLELCITSWTEIDACKIRLKKVTAGMKATLGVCAAILLIWWTGDRTDYTEVDDDPSGGGDGDTTYIATGVVPLLLNEDDLFGFETFNLPGGESIDSVKVYFRVRTSSPGWYGYARALLKISGTKYTTGPSFFMPPDTYTLYSQEWTINPNTGSPWTESDINNMSAGVRGKSRLRCINKCTLEFGYPVRCTQVYIEVTHSQISAERVQYSDGLVCVSVG